MAQLRRQIYAEALHTIIFNSNDLQIYVIIIRQLS